MKENKQITPDEVKAIQLDMLKEIDEFCRNNNIRYSLSYGTLLGAIRHKGYIPWDDDVDLIMPAPDLIRFKKEFKSDKLEYIDIDTNPLYDMPFPRVYDRRTINVVGKALKLYGISFDLYPVVGLPDEDYLIERFLYEGNKKRECYRKYTLMRNGIARRLPIKTLPFYRCVVKRLKDFVWQYPYEGAKVFYHHGGPFKRYEVFDYDVFGELIDVDFEGCRFLAPSKYDAYLKQCYGDYMKLPPEDKRHPYHGGNYYWK